MKWKGALDEREQQRLWAGEEEARETQFFERLVWDGPKKSRELVANLSSFQF